MDTVVVDGKRYELVVEGGNVILATGPDGLPVSLEDELWFKLQRAYDRSRPIDWSHSVDADDRRRRENEK